MIAGHLGFAAAVKAREQDVPLWALMLATAWLDVLFVLLLQAGVERIEVVPGASGYGSAILHADYTHSLVGAAALAALFELVASIPWGHAAAWRWVGSCSLTGCSTWRCTAPTCRSCRGTWVGCRSLASSSGLFPRPRPWSSWRSWRLAPTCTGKRRCGRFARAGARPRAHLVGGLALAAGIATLALDLLGV